MQQYLTIVLTMVITVTTIIYTFYSIQLWKTSRQSAEISRQAALGNLWSELNRYIEICRREGLPEAAFLQEFSSILAEYMIGNLINDINNKNDPNLAEFKRKIEEMVEAQHFDVSKIKWFAPLLRKK